MLEVLYEDSDIIVVKKPVGMESQSVHSFTPDLVSEIRKHINRLSTTGGEPYVGVIHRLDKPVGGIMVYAKTKKAAAALSQQVQNHQMKKEYMAVVCGKPVDNVGNFVDYLLKDGKNNVSKIVDKGITGAKRAELTYEVVDTIVEKTERQEESVEKEKYRRHGGEGEDNKRGDNKGGDNKRDDNKGEDNKGDDNKREDGMQVLSLVKIRLLTGRHHQIRVQFAGHGLPLWGDKRYGGIRNAGTRSQSVALSSCGLSFYHPTTKKLMEFHMEPEGAVFHKFFRIVMEKSQKNTINLKKML